MCMLLANREQDYFTPKRNHPGNAWDNTFRNACLRSTYNSILCFSHSTSVNDWKRCRLIDFFVEFCALQVKMLSLILKHDYQASNYFNHCHYCSKSFGMSNTEPLMNSFFQSWKMFWFPRQDP